MKWLYFDRIHVRSWVSLKLLYIQVCIRGKTNRMILPQPRHNEKYVIVIMFYSAEDVPIAQSNLTAYLIQTFENISGKSKHRHVGLSFGIINYKTIRLFEYDFSCWNGRNSGATSISKYNRDDKDSHMLICASDAIYFELNHHTYNNLVNNLILVHRRGDSNEIPGLPVNNIEYPSLQMILSDYCKSFCNIFMKTLEWKIKDIELCLDQNIKFSQCSQYVLGLIIHCIRHNAIAVSAKQKNEIFSLLFAKTALHPHVLFKILKKTGRCFVLLDKTRKLILSGKKWTWRKWGWKPPKNSILCLWHQSWIFLNRTTCNRLQRNQRYPSMMSRKKCDDRHFTSCRLVYIQNNNSYEFLRNNCCTPIAMMNKQTIEKKLSIKRVELFSSKASSSNAGRLVLFEILRMSILW